MKVDSIKNDLEANAAAVNKFLLSHLDQKPRELYQASSHYIKTGGKRLRPFMTIKACEMLGGTLARAMPAAGAVELLHNFSLVHDDIMDNDERRHGAPSVHRFFGLPLAIIAGDLLFSKAFELLAVHTRSVGITHSAVTEMVSRMSEASVEICEGQALDIHRASATKFPSEAEYIEMIGKKTAALFRVSCALGALSAPDYSKADVEHVALFGRDIGIAFQLVDDLIGVIGDPHVTGKAAGNDIREGKKTLPILLSIQKAKGEDRDRVLGVFGSKNASQAEVAKVVSIVSDLGIEDRVRKEARRYMNSAIKAISAFPESEARRSLESSADFVVGRSL